MVVSLQMAISVQKSACGELFWSRLYIKSTQCKKLAPNALWLTYRHLKSWKPHKKTKQKPSTF